MGVCNAKFGFNRFFDFKVWVLQVLRFQCLGFTGFGIPKFGFNRFWDSKVRI